MLAARMLVAIENPATSCASPRAPTASARCSSTRSTPAPRRRAATPPVPTQPDPGGFHEPRVLVLTDLCTDHQPISETAYVNLPTIAVHTDSPLVGGRSSREQGEAPTAACTASSRAWLQMRGTISASNPGTPRQTSSSPRPRGARGQARRAGGGGARCRSRGVRRDRRSRRGAGCRRGAVDESRGSPAMGARRCRARRGQWNEAPAPSGWTPPPRPGRRLRVRPGFASRPEGTSRARVARVESTRGGGDDGTSRGREWID